MNAEQTVTSTTADHREVLAKSGVVIALIGVPFMILLMYCAWLPVMMGMYFFILGGLLLGGIWYRLARKIRPAPSAAVYIAFFSVLTFWLAVYLGSEYYVKPWHMARDLADASTLHVGVNSPAEKQQRYDEAAAHVHKVLSGYGPGPIGYLVWNAVDGRMPPMPQYGGSPVALPQRQLYWILRIVASAVLLAYGLRLQVKDLARPEEPPAPAGEPPGFEHK